MVEYKYKDKTNQHGYRFLCKYPNANGNLQPARGQARIPNSEILFVLLGEASSDGWFVSSEKIKGIDNENT